MNRKNESVRSRWTRLAVAILVLTAAGVCSATASGVTVIIHGWQHPTLVPPGPAPYPDWSDKMAQAVTNVAWTRGRASTWFHVQISKTTTGLQTSIERMPDASTPPTGDIIVTVDWAELSYHVGSGNGTTTDQVAYELAALLRRSYYSIGLDIPLAAQPLHFIGHSRGGSVALETAHLLGGSGIIVDQVTTLDPHPLTSPDYGVYPAGCSPAFCVPPDPPVRLYDNVVFADNYWRQDSLAADVWIGSFDFNGQDVPGAHDVQLSEDVLDGLGSLVEHSDVHTWYHGTIGSGSIYPPTDGDVAITDAWYVSPQHPARDESGFAFSRLRMKGRCSAA